MAGLAPASESTNPPMPCLVSSSWTPTWSLLPHTEVSSLVSCSQRSSGDVNVSVCVCVLFCFGHNVLARGWHFKEGKHHQVAWTRRLSLYTARPRRSYQKMCPIKLFKSQFNDIWKRPTTLDHFTFSTQWLNKLIWGYYGDTVFTTPGTHVAFILTNTSLNEMIQGK